MDVRHRMVAVINSIRKLRIPRGLNVGAGSPYAVDVVWLVDHLADPPGEAWFIDS